MNDRHRLTMTVAVLLVTALGAVTCGGELTQRFCDLARPGVRPPGAPKASDVVMRTLALHPRGASDPHDTRQAIRDFHVSRLEWSYVTDKSFIGELQAAGRLFGGAASAPSYLHDKSDPGWYEKVVIRNAAGEPIIAPWKRSWNRTLWGCVNNPELERGYVEYLEGYIDAGAGVMQRDEPGANYNATQWGGCFCPHCLTAFRRYLADNTTEEQRRRLGVANLESFDYRRHAGEQGAPVGDPFARWQGGELKELFVEFQTQATIAFHRRTRKALDEYAGRRVPFSCNNGVHRWTPIELEFDWAFGELSYSRARPDALLAAIREAAAHNRIQVLTMPKTGDPVNPSVWQQRTRQTIAMTYACGGLAMVPWDVYMPKDAPRYFGTPEQYADLFGFVRAAAEFLDGYEEATAPVGASDGRRPADAPAILPGDEGRDTWAMVRAKPAQPHAPVVVHLVSWADEPRPCTLRLRTADFFAGKPLEARLIVPPPYDKATHQEAEQRHDYSSLKQPSRPASTVEGDVTLLEIPALTPWGIVIVSSGS